MMDNYEPSTYLNNTKSQTNIFEYYPIDLFANKWGY